MKKILVFLLIICMAFLIAGAQEEKPNDITNTEPVKTEPVKPVTHLKVTMIDGINDKVFELKNCIVQVIGELHICQDSFDYKKTFVEGTDYEITIMIKPKD